MFGNDMMCKWYKKKQQQHMSYAVYNDEMCIIIPVSMLRTCDKFVIV